jgi:glutathione peroxidase-family protein
MHDLYKFLKRNCKDLFIPRYGMAVNLYEYHTKFLCNKYGEVEKYYGPSVELAKIEADVKELIKEEFEEKKYRNLIEPVDMFS